MDQAQLVYDSERACSWWDKYAMPSEDIAYWYIRDMVQSRVWKRKYKIEPVFKLMFTKNELYDGAFWAWGNYPTGFKPYNTIEISLTGQKLSVLLHEFTHLLCYETLSYMGHGASFARCYLHMVGDFLGKDSAKELSHHMKIRGVER